MQRNLLLFLSVLIIIVVAGCGKKGTPYPKSNLNIPPPENIILTMESDGVNIYNSSNEYKLSVEKAEVELGPIFPPRYIRVAFISAGESYLDSDIKVETKYQYKLKNYKERFNAYSPETIKSVYYKGNIIIESVETTLKNNKLCLEMKLSDNVAAYDIYINGIVHKEENKCVNLPDTSRIILLIIPYSESGSAGAAYTKTLIRDYETTLLPPQNIKVLESNDRITISWDRMPEDVRYQIKITEAGGTQSIKHTDATVISHPLNECTVFELTSLKNKEFSKSVSLSACPESSKTQTE